MKVVAVIVTYNGMQWIERCVESLLGSAMPLDIVIIDNQSTDGTFEFLRSRYENRIELRQLPENLGFGRANNIGIKIGFDNQCDFIFLVNQDVYIEPDTTSKLVEAQVRQAEFGIVSPLHLNGTGNALDRNFLNYITEDQCPGLISDLFLGKISPLLYRTDFVNAAAWLISRKCIAAVGGFNPSFLHYGEDENYVQRAELHGFKTGICTTTTIRHDREQRKRSLHYKDDRYAYKRSLTTKMSYPHLAFKYNKERKRLYSELFKSALTLNGSRFTKWKNRLVIFRSMDVALLEKNRKQSLKREPSFL